MYALKPPPPNHPPTRAKRIAPKARLRKREASYQAIAYETTAKLLVNVVLSIVAVSALVNLLPYRSSQVIKLQEMEAAVKSTSARVERERAKFSYYFDPYQARENMQQLTDRIDPTRKRIIWKTPANSSNNQPSANQ